MKKYKTAARMIAAATIAISSMGLAVSQGIAAIDNGFNVETIVPGEIIHVFPVDVCEGAPDGWEVSWDNEGSYCACTGYHCSGDDDGGGGGGGGYEPPDDNNDPPPPGTGGFCDQDPDALSCQDEPEEENTCESEKPTYDTCGDESCEDCQSENKDCEKKANRLVTACYNINVQRAEAYCRVIGTPTEDCLREEITGKDGTITGRAHRNTWGLHGEGGGTFTVGPWAIGGSAGGSYGGSDSVSSGTSRPYVPPSASYSDCEEIARDLVLTCVADVNACYEVAEEEGEVCEAD